MPSKQDSDSGRADLNDYGGVIVATVTPCKAPGIVDADAMARLCQVLIERGCQGLFVVSSTGEMPLLDEDERQAIIEAAARGMQQRGRLYAGVTGLGLKQSLRYADAAARAGADVAVIMAPLFLRYSQAELFDYVTRFADASPLPVALYHHLRMPTAFDVDTVARLAAHDNIVAMKDTSGDLARMQAMQQATACQNFSLLQGSELLILPSLQAGAQGSVTALANVVPEWHAALLADFRRGDMANAQQWQDKIAEMCQMFFDPLVRESLSHFVYTLKRPLCKRGWLPGAGGMMGEPDSDALKDLIDRHLQSEAWKELIAASKASG